MQMSSPVRAFPMKRKSGLGSFSLDLKGKVSPIKVLGLVMCSLICGTILGHTGFLLLLSKEEREKARNAHLVIDIDIGTFGTNVERKGDKLLTFDPGDDLLISPELERYPYVISDYSGQTNFFNNQESPDCSTLNIINRSYNETTRDKRMLKNCGDITLPLPGALECMHPKRERVSKVRVQVRRLCDILKERGFTKVSKLKVDAQGTDFVILKDVVENCPHVSINEIMVECQKYEHTIPLYYTDNDCFRVEEYIMNKFPEAVVKWQLNVCWSGEFNLIFTNMRR